MCVCANVCLSVCVSLSMYHGTAAQMQTAARACGVVLLHFACGSAALDPALLAVILLHQCVCVCVCVCVTLCNWEAGAGRERGGGGVSLFVCVC